MNLYNKSGSNMAIACDIAPSLYSFKKRLNFFNFL